MLNGSLRTSVTMQQSNNEHIRFISAFVYYDYITPKIKLT